MTGLVPERSPRPPSYGPEASCPTVRPEGAGVVDECVASGFLSVLHAGGVIAPPASQGRREGGLVARMSFRGQTAVLVAPLRRSL